MQPHLLLIVIILLFSCSSGEEKKVSTKSNDSILQTPIKEYANNRLIETDTLTIEERVPFDTLPDYETFQDYLALFKNRSFPAVYDSMYVRSIEGNASSRLRFSRFFKLKELKEPEALNAFYARDKFDLGNGRIGVTIMTDVAPEVIGPDGELKTISFIIYDKNGYLLAEQTLFRFYNVFDVMEYSWGELNKDLMVHKYYYNSSIDDNNHETVDKGSTIEQLRIPK